MILHILKRNEWNDALKRGTYAPPSLPAQGFIHCSTVEQAAETANLIFRGQSDLVVLRIDERLLASPLKYEAAASGGNDRSGVLFAHIYGPLNLDAVIGVVDLPCDADGTFQLPAIIRNAD